MLNKVLLVGNLGTDVEMRAKEGATPVANFRLATNQASSNGKEVTEWHRVVVFAAQAESCAKFLKKGSLVHVEGRVSTSSWTAEGGQKPDLLTYPLCEMSG